MDKNSLGTNPYSIRLGKLKPLLEKKAFEKDIPLPQLIKGILKSYLKRFPPIN